jgi:hypothetical protein
MVMMGIKIGISTVEIPGERVNNTSRYKIPWRLNSFTGITVWQE